jgi:hypothetical protein
MQTLEMVFTRNERKRGITTLAIIQLECAVPMDRKQALEALERSVSTWAQRTEAGREVWRSSCGDLNIGDLASYGTDGLAPFLRENGLLDMAFLYVGGIENAISYDRVLAHVEADS